MSSGAPVIGEAMGIGAGLELSPALAVGGEKHVTIRADGLSKSYRIGARRERYKTLRESLAAAAAAPIRRLRSRKEPGPERAVWALKDVSFEVGQGEVVGVIGRNGAGKSTLLKVLSRITEPSHGSAEIRGRVGSLLEVGTGFHPELTGRENIFLNGAILGMRRAEIRSKFDEIVAFAEIARFIDTPVKHYSSGMYLRLAFAVAAHMQPEILLVDEVLAVGDLLFQKKCLGKMEDVARGGRTVLFVSHNMGAVRSLCTNGLVLEEGRVAACGPIGACIETYFRQIGAFRPEGEATGVAGEATHIAGEATHIAGEAVPFSGEPEARGFGRVSVTGPGGRSILQSEPFEARTRLSIGPDVTGFSLFCIVEDIQGRMVFHLREESPALGLATLSPGSYAIAVTIPTLWLNTGLYSLYFKAILWGGYGDARQVSDRIPLDITGSHSRVDAVLHPEASWTISRSG